MPPLRTRLGKRPETYLAVVLAAFALLVADSLRPPDKQVATSCWISFVHAYQRSGRPITRKFIRCRYQPTCSEYSAQAVAKYGIGHGLWMTMQRLVSCRASVPPGTLDPVP